MQIQNAILTGSTTVYGPITFVSGSLTGTASLATNASTASFVLPLSQSLFVTGGINLTGSLTVSGSITTSGTITAQTLVVQTITSSILYSSGSNIFGNQITNTQTFTGSIQASGSSTHFLMGGNVGIGTTSPSAKLDVRTDTGVLIKGATSNSDAILSFLPTTGGRQYDFRNFGSSFAILDSSANITRMYFNFSGNTGIGLTNPSALLHVSGSGSGSLMQISSHVSSSIFFVSGSGNIGIGTTTPGSALEIRSVIGNTILGLVPSTNTDYAFIKYTTANGTSYIGTDNSTGAVFGQGAYSMNLYNVGTAPIVFYTTGTARMYISGSGNVGIGTTTPTEKFDVIGGAVAAGNGTIRTGITYSTLGLIGTFTNHDLGVITNGTEKMRITSAGSVTIGSNLQFDSNGDFYQKTTGGAAIWSATANVTYPSYGFYGNTGIGMYRASADVLAFTTSASERMRITSAGYVGIGTTNPAVRFVVSNAGLAGIEFDPSGSTLNGPSINSYNRSAASRTDLEFAGKEMQFYTGNPSLAIGIKITSGGNVGIGTTTPGSKLHLYDGTNPLSLKIQRTTVPVYLSDVQIAGTTAGSAWSHNMENTSNGSFTWGSFTNTNYAGSAIILNADTSNSWITFYTTSSANIAPGERMRITQNGDVKIGNTSGDGRLYVKTAIANTFANSYIGTNANIRLETGGTAATNITTGISMGVGGAAEAYIGAVQNGSTYADIVFQTYNGSAYGERMRLNSAGNLLIGQTSANGSANGIYLRSGVESGFTATADNVLQLDRLSNTGNIQTFYYAGASVGYISTNGSTITFSGNALSDARYKENIRSIEGALNAINDLEFVTFNYKENNQQKSAGITAQQAKTVTKISDFVIDGESEEDFKAFDYNALIGYLGKAIQELSTKLEEATTRINALESK